MISKYLGVLELPTNAPLPEVKKAYRRLSKVYHPDVNKDPNAHQRFLEIKEAYDYLLHYGTNPEEPVYSYRAVTYEEHEIDPYELWRQEYRKRKAARERAEAYARVVLITKILRRFNYFAWFLIAFNLTLSLDFLLPDQGYTQQIVKKYRSFERARRNSYYTHDEFIFTDFRMRLPMGTEKVARDETQATVFASPILQIPNKVEIQINGHTQTFRQAYSFYKVHRFMIPLMLLLLFIYFKLGQLIESRLSLATVLLFFGLVQILLFGLYY